MYGCADVRMYGWMDGWMDGCMYDLYDLYVCVHIHIIIPCRRDMPRLTLRSSPEVAAGVLGVQYSVTK